MVSDKRGPILYFQMHAQLALANLNRYPLLKKCWLRTHIASILYCSRKYLSSKLGLFKNSDTQTQIAYKNGVRDERLQFMSQTQAILFVLGQNTFFTYNFIKKPKIFLLLHSVQGRSWGDRSVDLRQDAMLDLVAIARPRISVFGLALGIVSGHAVQKAQNGQHRHRPREEMPNSCNKWQN